MKHSKSTLNLCMSLILGLGIAPMAYAETKIETTSVGTTNEYQIVDKNGYSFYRSWTNKVNDHAASARLDIADMIKNPQPKRGISTGRFDMTFKTMIPLYNGKEFIGIIEMISKFNSIAKLLSFFSYRAKFLKNFLLSLAPIELFEIIS